MHCHVQKDEGSSVFCLRVRIQSTAAVYLHQKDWEKRPDHNGKHHLPYLALPHLPSHLIQPFNTKTGTFLGRAGAGKRQLEIIWKTNLSPPGQLLGHNSDVVDPGSRPGPRDLGTSQSQNPPRAAVPHCIRLRNSSSGWSSAAKGFL